MMYLFALSPVLSVDEVGGKAANLARLAGLGLTVPESRVLSRAALRAFLAQTGLDAAVRDVLADYQRLAWEDRQAAFERLRAAVMSAPLPGDLHAQVDAPLKDWLARAPFGLAVRSSGVCEDMEKASFAGMYLTRLGVACLDDFWQAVKACWCSAWSPQAEAYAGRMGLALPPDGMALLIQPLIQARAAGVIFTADPASGDPWRFVVNAVPGLADRLMDGAAPADRFELAWDTAEILDRRVATKPGASIFAGGQVAQVALEPAMQNAPALADGEVQQIGRLALAIDRAFDRRVDVEWALDGAQVVILQARPLTALPAFFPHTLTPDQAGKIWTPYLSKYGAMNSGERLIAPFGRERWMVKLWHRFLTPDDIFPRILFEEMDVNGYRYATHRSWGGSPHDQDYAERWLAENEPRLRRDWQAQLARVHAANQAADEAVQRAACAADWVRLTLALRREEYEMQAAVWYAAQWMGMTLDDMLQQFVAEVLPASGIPGLPGSLLQGLSCYSVERSAAAQQLGQSVAEPAVLAAFASRPLLGVVPCLRAEHPDCQFLQDFGALCRHFGIKSISPEGVKDPTGQDLEGLLLVVKASLPGASGRSRAVGAVLDASQRQRQATEDAVREFLRANCPEQLPRFERLLGWAQFWAPALDDRKWHCTMTDRLDWLIPRCGAELVAEGLIDRPDHFKLLTSQEWQAYIDNPDPDALRATYAAARLAYERNRRLEPLPYLGKAPQPPEPAADISAPSAQETPAAAPAAPAVAGAAFHGEGIAPGVVRGTACKVASLEDPAYVNRLTGETILICAADLADAQWRRDWYSLFMVVRGLVTVQGSALHHATQIARECGVPFLNLPEVDFAALPDEVEVEIDGQAGLLRVIG